MLRAQLEADRERAGKPSVQEKISFVKMEYFLYAFSEAHSLMRQLQKLGEVIKAIEEDKKVLEKEVAEALKLGGKLAHTKGYPGSANEGGLSRGGNR